MCAVCTVSIYECILCSMRVAERTFVLEMENLLRKRCSSSSSCSICALNQSKFHAHIMFRSVRFGSVRFRFQWHPVFEFCFCSYIISSSSFCVWVCFFPHFFLFFSSWQINRWNETLGWHKKLNYALWPYQRKCLRKICIGIQKACTKCENIFAAVTMKPQYSTIQLFLFLDLSYCKQLMFQPNVSVQFTNDE